MRKLLLSVVLVLPLVLAGTAVAKPVGYTGKTSSGHKITFTVKNGRIHDLTAGVATSCLAIQGGGAPISGGELFGFRGSVRLKPHVTFSFMSKPAFHYNEVTMKHDLWVTRGSGGRLSGKMRLQYSFLIPKYPIGTFSVYSCLGNATFKAKPRG